MQKLVRAGVIAPISSDSPQSSEGHLPLNNVDIVNKEQELPLFRPNNELYRLATNAVEQLRTPGKETSGTRKGRKKSKGNEDINSGTERTPLAEVRNNRNDTVGADSAAVSLPGSGFRASFR